MIPLSTRNAEVIFAAIFAGIGMGFMGNHGARARGDFHRVLPPTKAWTVPLWLVTHVDLHRQRKCGDAGMYQIGASGELICSSIFIDGLAPEIGPSPQTAPTSASDCYRPSSHTKTGGVHPLKGKGKRPQTALYNGTFLRCRCHHISRARLLEDRRADRAAHQIWMQQDISPARTLFHGYGNSDGRDIRFGQQAQHGSK